MNIQEAKLEGVIVCGVVELNKRVVWANVVELDDGLRIWLSLADWSELKGRHSQLSVRLPEKPEMPFSLTNVTEIPPNVAVTLSRQHGSIPEPV